jgi:hypothetical protein
VNPDRSLVFSCGRRSRTWLESPQLSTLERVCESLDGPMGDVIREAEGAEWRRR